MVEVWKHVLRVGLFARTCWYLVVFGETPGQDCLSCDVFVAVPKYLAQPRCALRADGQHQIEGSCRRSGFFCVCALGDVARHFAHQPLIFLRVAAVRFQDSEPYLAAVHMHT